MLCFNCSSDVLDTAKFCHVCGVRVTPLHVSCAKCKTENLPDAKFCHHCGNPMSVEEIHKKTIIDTPPNAKPYTPLYKLDYEDVKNLPTALRELFINELRQELQEEQNTGNEIQALESFYRSGFRDVFESYSFQLTQYIEKVWSENAERAIPAIDKRLRMSFHGLLERFWVRYAKDLAPYQLPDSILRYDNIYAKELNLRQMILDYLDVIHEPEPIYTNVVEVPLKKLQNARKSYLTHEKEEYPIVLSDLTVFGSGKEGFSFTSKGIYWKAHFNNPHAVKYTDLKNISWQREQWLHINEHYFHTNPRLNYKIYKLLRRIKLLFVDIA